MTVAGAVFIIAAAAWLAVALVGAHHGRAARDGVSLLPSDADPGRRDTIMAR